MAVKAKTHNKNKILFIVIDGLTEFSTANYLTPLQRAYKPCLNWLAYSGMYGTLQVLPFAPESDEAMLSLLGYDISHYSGRGVLEAYGIGVKPKSNALYLRCNIAKLRNRAKQELSRVRVNIPPKIINLIFKKLSRIKPPEFAKPYGIKFKFYRSEHYRIVLEIIQTKSKQILSRYVSNSHPGYRFVMKKNVLVSEALPNETPLFVEKVKPLPGYENDEKAVFTAKLLNYVVQSSIKLLGSYVLLTRGASTKLPRLKKHYKEWTILTGMPVEKAIAKLAGMKVKKQTSNLINAICNSLKTNNVYIQIKGPDSFAHRGDDIGKIHAIEEIDNFIAKLLQKLKSKKMNIRIVITADHSTSCLTRSHTQNSVVWLIYDFNWHNFTGIKQCSFNWNESTCKKGLKLNNGELMYIAKHDHLPRPV